MPAGSPSATSPVSASRIAAVRRFNRFYTRQIGLLEEGLLESPFSLTEVRVLYELAHRSSATATEISRDLSLDAGYLSRILAGFERRGLIRRKASSADARWSLLSLTPKGNRTFGPLDSASSRQVAQMIDGLSGARQKRLVDSMRAIEGLVGGGEESSSACVLRPPRPGDLGWVVHRHGALYAAEYGWDETFEALVAEIVAGFVQNLDPRRERCWIAERDGEIVGSVFLVGKSQATAKLRLLYVEPQARGLGLGARLVEECIRFARRAGYRKIVLWTQSVLAAARHIYEKAGFQLVESKPHRSFGQDLVAETWSLDL